MILQILVGRIKFLAPKPPPQFVAHEKGASVNYSVTSTKWEHSCTEKLPCKHVCMSPKAPAIETSFSLSYQ